MIIDNPIVSGSLNVQNNVTASNGLFTGDVTVLGSINATVQGTTATASYVALGNVDGFTDVSSSISSRLSAQENFSSSLNSTFATDAELSAVSGALALSISSISTDFADITNKPTLISSSAQIASDISGSFTSTSSSLAQRVSTNETNIASLTSVTSSYLQNTTDTLTGDLTVTGKITAQEFHTEFVSASIIYKSGSTQFGNSLDDTHKFTGSVSLTGSLFINGSEVGTGKLDETAFNSYTSSTDQRLDIAEGSISSLNDATASYALQSNISGAFANTSSSLAQRVSAQENFSSSLDATFATDVQVTAAVSDLNAATSSYALQADISGAFASTSSSLAQRISAQEDFSSSLDATFATDAELSAVSGALALSISSISTDFADITNKPTLISSSAQIASDISGSSTALSSSLSTRIAAQESFSSSLSTTELILSGSFSGSFIGDGSQLSGVTSYTDADTLAFINSRAVLSGSIAELTSVTASFLNTGSVTIPHSFNSKNVSVSVYDSNDILIIPQEIALISNSAVKLTFGGSTSGFAVVSKGGHIVSGSVPVPQLSTVTSAFTSATTHTVTHNFNTKEVIVSVYENDSLIIPDTVTTDDVNNVTVTFPEAVTGRVVVVKAGHIVSGSIPFDNLLDSPFVQSATAVTASKSIVPSQDITYDLGSSDKRFRDLYLSSASIYLGNTVISEDNVVTTASLQSVLPAGVISGSNQLAGETIDGDLTITGKVTAQEFHTEFVSASIVYESGSTKFGDTSDDTHEFTGSVLINGNVGIGTNLSSGLFKLESAGSNSGDITTGLRVFNTAPANVSAGQGTEIGFTNDIGFGNLLSATIKSQTENTSNGAANFTFNTWNGSSLVERMRINSNGSIGIGIDSPGQKLDVNGSIRTNSTFQFYNTGGSAYTPGVFDASYYRFVISGSEKMRITSAGSVGIGTTSPDAPLTIHNSTDPEIRFGYSSSQDHRIVWDSSKVFIHADPENANGSSALGLAVDGTTRLYINDSGNVGIGTTTPRVALDINGEVAIAYNATYGLRFYNDAGNNWSSIGNNITGSSNANLVFKDAFGEAMRIEGGNVGIGTDSPAYKLDVSGDSTSGVVAIRNAANGRDTLRSENAAGTRTFNIGNDSSGHGIVLVRNSSGTTTNYIAGSGDSYLNGGNVGIGTTSPIRKLHIDGGSISSDTPTVRISSTDSSGTNKFGIEFYSNNGADVRGKLLADNNGRVYIDDNGGGGVVLQANGGSGNVGIGTGAPSETLHVLGGKLKLHNQANGYGWIYGEDTNHSIILRGNRAGTPGNYTHYYQYGSDYSAGGGHHFYTGGAINSQAVRFSIANDYSIFQNTKLIVNGTTTSADLFVNGTTDLNGVIKYRKVYGSISTTGNVVARLIQASNGASAFVRFECYGGGGYQRIVYNCINSGGNWSCTKQIDEGANALDVTATSGLAPEFTFKGRSASQGYSPSVSIEGTALDPVYYS